MIKVSVRNGLKIKKFKGDAVCIICVTDRGDGANTETFAQSGNEGILTIAALSLGLKKCSKEIDMVVHEKIKGVLL